MQNKNILTFIALLAALSLNQVFSARCTISTTGINFGVYNPLSATPLDSNGTVTIRCRKTRKDNNASGYVDLYPGAGSGGSCNSPRILSSGSNSLQYNIYKNASRSTVWCWNGSNGTGWQSFNFPNLTPPVTQTYTAYGRIFGSQTSATPGAYTQTIWASTPIH
jgi:spore coat protein U-like protein